MFSDDLSPHRELPALTRILASYVGITIDSIYLSVVLSI